MKFPDGHSTARRIEQTSAAGFRRVHFWLLEVGNRMVLICKKVRAKGESRGPPQQLTIIEKGYSVVSYEPLDRVQTRTFIEVGARSPYSDWIGLQKMRSQSFNGVFCFSAIFRKNVKMSLG
jgi:hypothetical protein